MSLNEEKLSKLLDESTKENILNVEESILNKENELITKNNDFLLKILDQLLAQNEMK